MRIIHVHTFVLVNLAQNPRVAIYIFPIRTFAVESINRKNINIHNIC